MQQIKPLLRTNYTGEVVTTELNFTGGEWIKTQDFIPNAVTNTQISNRAVVLGNGPSRTQLYANGNLFQLLANHRGGLLAAGRVQTYGCNAIVRDFIPDFVVANDEVAAELARDPGDVPAAFADLVASRTTLPALVLWELRIPRALLGVLVGFSLGLTGAAMQGYLRNPLADPGILDARLQQWLMASGPGSISRWYLEHVAMKGTAAFARLVPLGELSCGLALITGFWTPLFAFVAFLMALCNQKFTATQFALLSAFAAVGRVWVGPLSGVLTESIGWPAFFLFSTAAALPGLLMLAKLKARVQALDVPKGPVALDD